MFYLLSKKAQGDLKMRVVGKMIPATITLASEGLEGSSFTNPSSSSSSKTSPALPTQAEGAQSVPLNL